MAEPETNGAQTRLFDRIKAYLTLNVENIRLTVAEKLIVLLAAILTTAICLILGGIAMLFITVAIAQVLSFWLPLWLSYCIMAGVNILLLMLLFIFRRVLILNPISRAVTRIILS